MSNHFFEAIPSYASSESSSARDLMVSAAGASDAYRIAPPHLSRRVVYLSGPVRSEVTFVIRRWSTVTRKEFCISPQRITRRASTLVVL